MRKIASLDAAWIQYTDALDSSMVSGMARYIPGVNIENMTQDEAFGHIKRALGEIDGLLLVVDNADKKMAEDLSLEFLQKIPCVVMKERQYETYRNTKS